MNRTFWRARMDFDQVVRSTKRCRRYGTTQVTEYCRRHRHDPVKEQRQALASKLRGHYGYYGITGNYRALAKFYREVTRVWHKWLSRRSRKAYINWERMERILEPWRLPRPRITHSYIKRVANP